MATVTNTSDKVIARPVGGRWRRGGDPGTPPGRSLPGRGGAPTAAGTGGPTGGTQGRTLSRRPDAQHAVVSNTEAGPGGAGESGDEGAQGLEGGLAHLEPETTAR